MKCSILGCVEVPGDTMKLTVRCALISDVLSPRAHQVSQKNRQALQRPGRFTTSGAAPLRDEARETVRDTGEVCPPPGS